MKLNQLKDLHESSASDEASTVRKAPAPGDLGQYISSAQAAKILGVEMSRIRQLVAEKKLKSHNPTDGRRDHMFKESEVRAFAEKEKDKGGRPTGS